MSGEIHNTSLALCFDAGFLSVAATRAFSEAAGARLMHYVLCVVGALQVIRLASESTLRYLSNNHNDSSAYK